jgi:hypothetical protein
MGSLPWSAFYIKLNERFTLHNHILKDGQELLNLCQFDGLGAMGGVCPNHCVLVKFQSNEKGEGAKGGFPPWLVALGS